MFYPCALFTAVVYCAGDAPINVFLFQSIGHAFASFSTGLVGSLLKAVAFFVPGTLVRNPSFFMYATSAEHCAYNVEAGLPLTTNFGICVEKLEYKIKVPEKIVKFCC